MTAIYTTADAKKICGLTSRQLDELARKRQVEPTGLAAHGKGTRRVYFRADVGLLRAAGLLRQVGIVGVPFDQALNELRHLDYTEINSGKLLVIRNGKVSVMTVQNFSKELTKSSSCSVVLPLRELIPE